MDINKLVEALRATLQPDQREEAEKYLAEVTQVAADIVPASYLNGKIAYRLFCCTVTSQCIVQ